MNEFWLGAYRGFFSGRKILLGISGSIAAFKAVDIVRLLKKCGADVRVVLTDSAEQFVTPLTLETLSENPVYTSMFAEGKMQHIELARWADAILVAPATANTIAQLANGLAGNLLTTEILASRAPVFIAPAMNPTMFQHPATQENLSRLRSYGYTVFSPEHGLAACGDEGVGRMMEPTDILENLSSVFCSKARQKTVLISLGATRSYVDPVRYFTNRSSGKMGAALAYAALRAGYHVEIIAGPTSVPLPRLAQITRVVTTDQMAGAVMNAFPACDLFFSTAAVLDLEFKNYSEEKVKKGEIGRALEFTETVDILRTVGAEKKRGQVILGFAAETENFVANARKKLRAKNCDAVFVNPIKSNTSGFESDQNGGTLVTPRGTKEFKVQNKHELATGILTAMGLS